MFEAESVLDRVLNEKCEHLSHAFCILFSGREIIVTADWMFPMLQEMETIIPGISGDLIYIGRIHGQPCFGGQCKTFPEELPVGFQRVLTRRLLTEAEDYLWHAVSRLQKLVFWRKQHRYCGACRAELVPSQNDSGLKCPECGAMYFPQISPAVIVAVRKEGKLLLAHNRNFERNVHSLIAGFMEVGETPEQTVRREIFEETALQVKNIRYLGSQPWPFPNSLMLAFEAEYESGEATPDGVELTSLGWFSADDLPELPMNGSIARRVIDRIFPGHSGCNASDRK